MDLRVLCIADLHGWLPRSLPDADVLIIAGDICPVDQQHTPHAQLQWLNNRFKPWLDQVATAKGRRVVWTWGNHDFVGQDPLTADKIAAWTQAPLVDAATTIDGAVFHASPWTPTFGHWAFMADDDQLQELAWSRIEDNIDVLITHGPAYELGDRTLEGDLVGSKSLVPHLFDAAPRLHVCGHIHEGFGVHKVDEQGHTVSVNASVRRRDYSIRCKAWMVTLSEQMDVRMVDLERDYWQPSGAQDPAPWGLHY